MNLFFLSLSIAALVYTVAVTVRTIRLIRISKTLVRAARSYTNTEGHLSVLVLGDSTAVGVGSEKPEESVPGRLGVLLHASVENYAHSGAVVAELAQQLERAKRDRYDLVLIQAGGNDIIKLQTLRESDDSMDRVLSAVRTKSDRIVLLTAGRIGKAPMFPRLIAPLFTARSRTLRSMFIETAQKHRVLYVDLLGMSDVLNSDPDRYYAADMLHLTGSGYGVWFEKVESAARERWPELFTSAR